MDILIRVPESILPEQKRAQFKLSVEYRFRNIAHGMRQDWNISNFDLSVQIEWTKSEEKKMVAFLPNEAAYKGNRDAHSFFKQKTRDSLSKMLDMCEVLYAEVEIKHMDAHEDSVSSRVRNV